MSAPLLETPATILPTIIQRWSPRAFANCSVNTSQLQSIITAAAMAPSAYNSQPWRFIYSLRGDEYWEALLSTLNNFNRNWARHASALILVASTPYSENDSKHRTLPYHQFDCGTAWMQLALQASHLGLHSHAMAGIEREAAYAQQLLPPHWQLHIAVAVGYAGQPDKLPTDLRNQEVRRPRLPLSQIAYYGRAR